MKIKLPKTSFGNSGLIRTLIIIIPVLVIIGLVANSRARHNDASHQVIPSSSQTDKKPVSTSTTPSPAATSPSPAPNNTSSSATTTPSTPSKTTPTTPPITTTTTPVDTDPHVSIRLPAIGSPPYGANPSFTVDSSAPNGFKQIEIKFQCVDGSCFGGVYATTFPSAYPEYTFTWSTESEPHLSNGDYIMTATIVDNAGKLAQQAIIVTLQR